MTVHVGLGNGSKAQQFAQLTTIGNMQKELLMGGKGHMVGDDKLFNTASELVKLSGHSNPARFFDDPSAKDPQTGQLLHPPAPPPPDPKVQVEQMRQQGKQQEIQANAQVDQAKTSADIIHQQVKAQADIAVAQMKAEVDAKLKLLDAHLKMMDMHQEMAHQHQEHRLNVAQTALGMAHDHQAHQQKLELAEKAAKQQPKGDA
jgi:hypothetical protein